MYIDAQLAAGWQVLIYLLGLLLFGAIFYMSAWYYFRAPHTNARIQQLRQFLRLSKKFVKGKPTDLSQMQSHEKSFAAADKSKTSLLTPGADQGQLLEIYQEMSNVRKKCKQEPGRVDEAALEELIAIEQRLEQENRVYLRRQGYPWYVLFCTCVAVALLLQFGFIPAMEYTVL